MDRQELKIFENIEMQCKLLKANWNALKVNPTCERQIITCLNNIDNCFLVLADHISTTKRYKENFKNRHREVKNETSANI
jgi:hypothetical protein